MKEYNTLFKYEDNVEQEFRKICFDSMDVYKRLNDELSKKLYGNCLLYSLTNDEKYIAENILLTDSGQNFYKAIRKNEGERVFIYGAGERGENIVKLFPEINWVGYIDKYKKGKLNNLEIHAIENVDLTEENLILLTIQEEYKQVKTELINMGVAESRIIVWEEWNEIASIDRYFETRCIPLDKCSGAFVDAGSYDANDTIKFFEHVGEDNEAYIFEPDSEQFKQCKERLSDKQDKFVFFYEKGLSDSCVKEKFIKDGNRKLSCISSDGLDFVETIALDEICKDKKIGFIKMDIEGYEEKALRGAKEIIEKQKPLLAISIYHKRSDIYTIPKQILSYNSSYQFSIGHYWIGQVDTILYAF